MLFLLHLTGFISLFVFVSSVIGQNSTPVAFFSPIANGGNQFIVDALGDQQQEPLNVILSALSSAQVLTVSGIQDFMLAMGFGSTSDCASLGIGNIFPASLGDGTPNGTAPTDEFRQDFEASFPGVGVCIEILVGANHARTYIQNGTKANSGAVFIAASKELGIDLAHTIVPTGNGGYNEGREYLVGKAVAGAKSPATGINYIATAQNITNLMNASVVNHNISQDGIVTLLTVNTTMP